MKPAQCRFFSWNYFMHLEWLALISAFLWASGSLLSAIPAKHMGTFAFSRWRMIVVTTMLGVLSFITHGFETIQISQVGLMALSGFIGIFIGDTALYACMNCIGPRRSSLLFATHAVFSACFGFFLFDERFGWMTLLGAVLVLSGVLLAILGNSNSANHYEQIHGKLFYGVGLGLIAGLCQSFGTIIAKPVMASGVDPIAASSVRMVVALAAHLFIRFLSLPVTKTKHPMTYRMFGIICLNGLMAMVIGMTLFMFALRHGDVTLVSILSTTSPVMLLPILWITTRQRPSKGAWFGACFVVLGTAMVLLR